MRAVVQRVKRAKVTVEGRTVGEIGAGLLVLLGITHCDDEKDARYMADKIAGLRVFEDDDGKMNLSVEDVGGSILSVSQFTLYGDCRKGRRPSFSEAARPEQAAPLYEAFNACLRQRGLHVETGVFGAMMDVELVNWGPVTLLVDSRVV
ncbi:MAG: D-tyrosyl-tRNA(Tyr) deacylase [Candidatus Reconcilbacillus cellulovorans]|uniref:D-aminoacyl-tRNA deacylase n=1 Tax=Candidatus Reconcilbacillus cellulovorans TaxID=1906605 RepID=A0A2A6DZR4_9BACL|nr:MAG: D-tyrosyl-tRNA(Tyr) deacylase [Candidatus Reconcilbacillus cellulovorans]